MLTLVGEGVERYNFSRYDTVSQYSTMIKYIPRYVRKKQEGKG